MRTISSFFFEIIAIFANNNLRKQAAPRQFERARLYSVCTVFVISYKTIKVLRV